MRSCIVANGKYLSTTFALLCLALVLLAAPAARASERLKPFVLASSASSSDLQQAVQQTEQALRAAGFTIVGSYAPYTNAAFADKQTVSAVVIGVTDPELAHAAAQTPFGGYAIVQRVAVTRISDSKGSSIEVSYTNPQYMAAAYRLKSDLAAVGAALAKALGSTQDYGSHRGMTASDLHGYHYKIFMPYFDDMHTLARYASYDEALAAVEAGLAQHAGGASKVWQVAVPGKQQTLFGVGLAGTPDNACSGDEYIMHRIDFGMPKSTANVPYAILVSGDKAYSLATKFRIAINFPDLSMMGSHSFMSIMCAPDAIEKALKAVARTKPAAPAPAAAASAANPAAATSSTVS